MKAYGSTRNADSVSWGFADLLAGGLASGDGLSVPFTYSQLSRRQISLWRFLSYTELAFRVSRPFLTDVPFLTARHFIRSTYNKRSFLPSNRSHLSFGPVGLKLMTGGSPLTFVAELAGGLSSSFKDIAMQLLGILFSYSFQLRHRVLGATSGDTGSSACYALTGRAGCCLTVLSPHQSVTSFQAEQMFGILLGEASNISLNGKFDCCQNILKSFLSTGAAGSNIGTVNSINWVRIIFQVSYYFATYFRVTSNLREPVTVAVPSGNFGNSFAGMVAKFAGLPIKTVVISTNENNVLEEFFKTGKYTSRTAANTLRTDCPSMDISKASNLERLIFEIVNRNGRLLTDAFRSQPKRRTLNILKYGSFRFVRSLGITSNSTYERERSAIVRSSFGRFGILLDSHTSNGVGSLLLKGISHPKVVLETAQVVKTKELVARTVGGSYLVGAFRGTKYLRIASCLTSHISQMLRP